MDAGRITGGLGLDGSTRSMEVSTAALESLHGIVWFRSRVYGKLNRVLWSVLENPENWNLSSGGSGKPTMPTRGNT